RRDRVWVVRNEFALDLLQNAARVRVEVLDSESSFLGLELKRVPYSTVVPGLCPLAKRGRLAMFKQRLQFVLLVERIFCTDDFKPVAILEDKCDWLVRNERSFARKWSSHAMDCQPQILEFCSSFFTHGFRCPFRSRSLSWQRAVLRPGR